MTPKAQMANYKVDFIKIKKFYVSKDIIKRVKTQPIEWEKCVQVITLIRSWHPGSIENTCNSTTRTDDPIKKWTELFDRYFS